MSLLPAAVAVATCLPLVVRTALALSSFCHTSYVGRGLNLERPRRKANHLRTLHPGHALGTVSKRVGLIKPRRQTNCSLGQGRASPAQYLPHFLCRARAEFGSYSGGNPLFQKWQKCPLKQSLGKVAKVLCKSVLGLKLLRRKLKFRDFGPDFLQNCHFYFQTGSFTYQNCHFFLKTANLNFYPNQR